ncbi:mitochondrial 37S ribosomal protein nam9 [Pleurotus pulmonarius]|nr:mitochondrial 37S ribosomal protein nam9 [Pleurotus pulmonarius]KAF4607376.1 mitochondrial 37S ribosomal protein nam9 [Pleurotus pulmonarius]
MKDAGIYSIKRALPRMSWTPKNLYNLWLRSKGSRADELKFTRTHKSLFQQRWVSKAVVRAYHGDYINEKIFKRWYLPETLPDVRPRRKVLGDDSTDLEAFALRKKKEKDLEEEVEKKGMAPVGSLMFSEVERRIDVFIFRCCFVHSVYEARRLVIHGDVMLNGKKHQNANTRLAPGDMVSVNPDAIRFFKTPTGAHDTPLPRLLDQPSSAVTDAPREDNRSLTPFYLPPYASPWMFIPAYIETNFKTCSAIYVRHPTARPGYSEIPTPYAADGEIVRFAWEWYVKNRPRVRSKAQLARMPEDRALAMMDDKEDHHASKRLQVSQRRLGKRLARRRH